MKELGPAEVGVFLNVLLVIDKICYNKDKLSKITHPHPCFQWNFFWLFITFILLRNLFFQIGMTIGRHESLPH
jgi:hypothetical protein